MGIWWTFRRLKLPFTENCSQLCLR
jgi:hypothetical protein